MTKLYSELYRTCMTCDKEKPATDFYVRNKVTMVRHSICKECDKERVKKRHEENPERTRNNDLKRNYGITLDEHTQMYEEQNDYKGIKSTKEWYKKGQRKKYLFEIFDKLHTELEKHNENQTKKSN